MSIDNRTRLGQLLIQRGLLSRTQLVKALSGQMVYGGRLGTNLIELEFVSLQDIGETLAAQQGVGHASPDLLANIDDAALQLLPLELAREFNAVPLGLNGDECMVAMMDPSPSRVAELSHQIRRPLRPFVTPELRLLYLLEHHYEIPRANRYLRLPDGGEQASGRRRYLAATVERDESSADPAPGQPIHVAPLPGQTSHYRAVAGQSPLTGQDAPGEPQTFDHVPVVPGGTGEYRAVTGAPRPVYHVLRALDTADSGGAIARLLVHPLCPEASVSVLFWVRGNMAVGCCAHGVGATLNKLQHIVLPLDAPSLMHSAHELHSLVRAKGHRDPMQHSIALSLDTPSPNEVCVAPVILGERVVNLIVVHAHGNGFSDTTLRDYREMAGTATNAYAALRNQLRT